MSGIIETRKTRWQTAYAEDAEPGHLFFIRYALDERPRPLPLPSNQAERIEYAWNAYERHLARISWLQDDSIPALHVYTGTEIFAAAFGCPVHYSDDNMPFALPLIHDAAQVADVRVPDISTPQLAQLFDIADELKRRGGPEALLQIVDLQSPMDIAALIWDKNDFYVALLESPEAVKELAAKVSKLLVMFLDEWFSRYGTAYVAHYPDYYMHHGITLSVDEVGVVNEELFATYFLPELCALSERYGGIGIHCCANSRHQWANFLRIPNLRVLNLVQPDAVIRDSWEYFASHLLQIPYGAEMAGPAWTWPEQYPAQARMVFETRAESYDEARMLSERLHQACGRA